jgi:hypothetical protein
VGFAPTLYLRTLFEVPEIPPYLSCTVVRPDDDDVATNDSFILMPEAYSSCLFI